MSRLAPVSGLILLDKPIALTSHDAVHWLRGRLGQPRVGHAGTLDPLASGLLPCLVGPSTRLVDFLHEWPKTYVGLILLGRETPTGDLDGVPIGELVGAAIPPQQALRAARERLTGRLQQVPPAYSAKKIRGTPAHRLARAGGRPALPAVTVTVHRLRLSPRPGGRLAFAARVSSGTYLRALARDLGRLLGVGGCLVALRRTGVGPLRVRGALAPAPDLEHDAALRRLIRPVDIPLPLHTVRLETGAESWFRCGRPVPGPVVRLGKVRVLGPAGLEGVGEVDATGALQPRVVLAASAPRAAAQPPGLGWTVAEDLAQG